MRWWVQASQAEDDSFLGRIGIRVSLYPESGCGSPQEGSFPDPPHFDSSQVANSLQKCGGPSIAFHHPDASQDFVHRSHPGVCVHDCPPPNVPNRLGHLYLMHHFAHFSHTEISFYQDWNSSKGNAWMTRRAFHLINTVKYSAAGITQAIIISNEWILPTNGYILEKNKKFQVFVYGDSIGTFNKWMSCEPGKAEWAWWRWPQECLQSQLRKSQRLPPPPPPLIQTRLQAMFRNIDQSTDTVASTWDSRKNDLRRVILKVSKQTHVLDNVMYG